jgi:hypothetical protein
MHTIPTRRSVTACIILLLLTVAAIAGVDTFGKDSRVFGSIGPIQSRKVLKRLVDSPTDAYRVWKDSGYRGRTVVYVTGRWESFDPDKLISPQMFRAYPLPTFNVAHLLEDTALSDVTFLYIASLNKICRKIVAMLPESEVVRLGGLSRGSKDARVSDKGVFVSRQGFPRFFVDGAHFGGVREPVLLYIGASYFRTEEPETLYRQLNNSGLQVDCLILCKETGRDIVTAKELAKLDSFAKLIN